MKKLISVLLTMVLVLSMYSAAMAANSITQQGNTVGAAGWSVTWTDTFTVVNGDTSTQNLPAATFNYAIEGGTGAAATADSPLIKAGVGNPSISNATHDATTPGTDALSSSVDVTVSFPEGTFTEAGIYRYNVTETGVVSSSSADIEIDIENENKGTYVLDVYVQKNADGTFSPYAYVLSKAGTITKFYETEEDSQKVMRVEYTGKVNEIVNELTTYDLTITKEIIGSVAANQFNFTIDIGNVPEDVYILKVKDGQETQLQGGTGIYLTNEWLADGGTIVFKGLPSIATYAIKEAVNQLEGYKVSVEETKEDTNSTAGTYEWIGTDTFGINNSAVAMGKGDVEVTFKNELLNISPTGVVLRVAPYALILIAGVALLLISRRRKTEKE